jgi:hypothetical protein
MSESSTKQIIFYLSLIVIVSVLLQACRSSSSSQPGSASVPQATPPIATASLTVAPARSDSTPTSVIAERLQLSPYTHPSKRFSINHPDSWEPYERPDGVIFIEPGDKAGYSVVFSEVGRSYSEQELNQYLVTFVAQNFAGEGSGFKAINQEALADGSIVAQFASNDPDLGRAISEVRVFQDDTIVFVLHFSTTADQWASSRQRLEQLVNSFRALDSGTAAEVPLTEEPPQWELIGPENERFGFFYADNWEIVAREGSAVTVREPNADLVFTAGSFAWPNAADDPEAAEKAALKHMESLAHQFEQVQHLPPAEFQLDTSTGTTIDFFYNNADDAAVAGSVITAVHDDRMYKIVFTALAEPAEQYDLALQWFNPMIGSFKFLSPDDP